ncbi:MAG: hypothetical protein IJH25_00260, partial [Clostridia bacterium]|nr:hypothetical protein [Clostridia bacterium]
AGATLAVEEVEGDYLEQTAELLKGKETITLARFFDITILDAEGNAVQPAQPVEVKATLAEQSADAVKAVHFAEAGPEIIEASQEEDAVSFDAASFSVYGIVYTVDFHYGEAGKVYEISLPGGGAIGLRELAVALGLVEVEATEEAGEDIALGNSDAALDFIEDVENVVFSNEELIRIVPVDVNVTVGALKEKWGLEPEYTAELTEAQLAELNGKLLQAPDWALVSMKPFDTDETLTVTMKNGDVITVAVTDAQLQKSVIAASGETYVITVTYDDDAEIPEDAGLRVTEILPGDEGYEDYLNRAMQALSGERTEIEAVELTNDEPAEAGEAPEAGEDEAEQVEAGDAQADYARFFDIQIWAGDRQIEPKAAVSVRIELADAPEERQDALAVVHFEADGPVVMDAEVVSAADIRFETESFSTYGVIRTASSSQFTSSNVDDLIGKPFTLSRNGQYFKAEIDPTNTPTLLKKASGEADAGVWFIKKVETSSQPRYILYTYNDSGEELQLQFTACASGDGANVNLVNGGNWFEISQNGDKYTFRGWLNSTDNYYLNYWEGG